MLVMRRLDSIVEMSWSPTEGPEAVQLVRFELGASLFSYPSAFSPSPMPPHSPTNSLLTDPGQHTHIASTCHDVTLLCVMQCDGIALHATASVL